MKKSSWLGVADYDKDGAFEYIYYQYGGTATTNTYYLNLYELSLL